MIYRTPCDQHGAGDPGGVRRRRTARTLRPRRPLSETDYGGVAPYKGYRKPMADRVVKATSGALFDLCRTDPFLPMAREDAKGKAQHASWHSMRLWPQRIRLIDRPSLTSQSNAGVSHGVDRRN